jgi:cytoskeletal protein CcmA (bactofilin family)
MFSKASKASGQDQRADTPSRSVPSIISSDLTITGDLVSAGEIQIDGTIEGDISCKALIIGVQGSVTGEIEAESVRLHGQVNGQMRAKTVFLAATARMVGDITHESLAIEPGAFMEGHCRRMGDKVAEAASRKTADFALPESRRAEGPAAALAAPSLAEDEDDDKDASPLGAFAAN